MTMLLTERLSTIRLPDAPSPSPVPIPVPAPVLVPGAASTASSSAASHSRPSSYGFANGEPLMLSILSSFRGQRGGGGYAGVFGIAGLKFEVEGTRTGEGAVTWRAREAAVCLMGDAARKTGADGMRATLWGFCFQVFWANPRLRQHAPNKKGGRRKGTYGAWRLLGVDAGGDSASRERRWLLLGRWRCKASLLIVTRRKKKVSQRGGWHDLGVDYARFLAALAWPLSGFLPEFPGRVSGSSSNSAGANFRFIAFLSRGTSTTSRSF